MGNLKFGTNSPFALYMGVSGSTKAYYGTTEVFPGGGTEYSKEYLTFEILTGGTISWMAGSATIATATTRCTLSYSKNYGPWTEIVATTGGTAISVNAGDSVRFQGNTKGTSAKNDTGNYCTFSGGTAYFNVSGNIMSLAKASNFENATLDQYDTETGNFKSLFAWSNAVNAENLYLPNATMNFQYRNLFRYSAALVSAPNMENIDTLASYAFMNAFQDCVSLTGATMPSAANLTTRCYEYMFSGCTNFAYAKCLAYNNITNTNVQMFLFGVASTGTFVKHPDATWPRTVSGGVPDLWTVIDA